MSVKVENDAAVTTIILDRPAVRNAVDGPTATALAQAFRDFEKDPQARVAVLYGRGSFCAGADLQAVGSGQNQNQLQAEGDGPMGPTRMQLAKPVIAAIEGHAVAGGLELAAWCDLRVAAEDAVLGVFCRRFGVPLIDGGSVRLPPSDRNEPGPGPDSDRAPRERARSPCHGSGEPGLPPGGGPGPGRGAGPPAGGVSQPVSAQGPAECLSAMGTATVGGDGQ